MTVQTFDALVREKVVKATTTERRIVGAMLACRDPMIEKVMIAGTKMGNEWTGVKPL